MMAISVRQPWAWLLIHGPKRLENRDWTEGYLRIQTSQVKIGERIAIHAAKGMTRDEYAEAFDMLDCIDTKAQIPIVTFDELKRGGIIGTMVFNGVVRQSRDPWFVGPLALRLDDPQPTEFRPCAGRLGFFRV